MSNATALIEKLASESHKSEIEVMALALDKGLRVLWREYQLGRYLRKQISRDEVIELVGIDWVELAERQQQAALKDIAWAFGQ